ncbi:hypothetical protein D3C86_1554510 [compost metagenome]
MLGLHVIHGVPGDVAGHQVRGELDACELTAEATGEGAYQQGLAQPRHAFEQYVAASDQRGQHVVDHAVLANHGFLQFFAYGLGQMAGTLTLLSGMARCVGLDRLIHWFRSLANCYIGFIFHKSVTYLI